MYYTVIVLTLERFKFVYDKTYEQIARELNLHMGSQYHEEKEAAYDWVVTNAIMNYIQGRTAARVINHYRHDVYRCIYDRFHNELYLDFANQFEKAKIKFNQDDLIKVMVTGQNLFIAKGFTDV